MNCVKCLEKLIMCIQRAGSRVKTKSLFTLHFLQKQEEFLAASSFVKDHNLNYVN